MKFRSGSVSLALAAAVAAAFAGVVAMGGACSRPPVMAPKSFDPNGSDPQALRVVDDMVRAMGGWSGWQKVKQIRFEYVVDKGGTTLADVLHAWDIYGGRHTMEEWYETKLIVVMQEVPNFAKGYVAVQEVRVASDVADPLLAEGQNRFESDSYPLVAPFKLRDPGVHVRYQGVTSIDDVADPVELIAVTFDPGTGDTPEDHFWYYVSRVTHLPVRWDYVLQEEIENNDSHRPIPRTGALWSGWKQVGPIKLALKRAFVRGPVEIHYRNVEASSEVETDLFVPYTTSIEMAFGTGSPTAPPPGAGGSGMIVQ